MIGIFIGPDGRLRSGWRFLIAVAAVFFSFAVAMMIASIFTKQLAIFESINRPTAAALLFAAFVMFSRVLDQAEKPASSIGLGVSNLWPRDWIAGAACGALLVSACVSLIALFGGYTISTAEPQTVSRTTALGIVAWILLSGALAEELAFRSYPFLRLVESLSNASCAVPAFRRYSDRIGSWGAIIITAGLFGAIHLGNPNATFWGFADTVLIGILFGLLMIRTGSLWLLWGIHFGWNFTLGVLFGLPVSGVEQFSVLWRGVVAGPVWLTGGAYGIEASATAAVVILVCILGVGLRSVPTAQEAIGGIQPK